MNIRNYQANDETAWLRCRVLSFLNTSYFDNVLNKKEVYKNPSIELIAEKDEKIVGLLDLEVEEKVGDVCTQMNKFGGMIWHIAVHPDFYRLGIGTKLLIETEYRAKQLGVEYLEAWTRDDQWVQQWYEKNGFKKTTSYYHVFLENQALQQAGISHKIPNFHLVNSFAHYVGEDINQFKETRIHECVCYVKEL